MGDAAVRNAYLKAAEEIGSDHEHHRALSAAVASGKLSGDSLVAVLRERGRAGEALRSGR